DRFKTNKNLASPALQAKISQHQSWGTNTMWIVLALGLAVLILAILVAPRAQARQRRTPDDTLVERARRSAGSMVAQVVMGLIVIVLAGVSVYYVYRTGDSGARMVWSGF